MSCWRTCTFNVENYNKDFVKEAIKRMGYGIDDKPQKIGGKIQDGRLTKNDQPLPVGITWSNENGVSVLEGDFYYTGFDSMKFMQRLMNEYNLQLQIAAAEAAGYTVDEATYNVLEDGSVEIEAYVYA